MKNVIIISSLLAVVACKPETPKEVKLENELDSVSYSLGVNIGENINKQFEEYSLDNFIAGMKGVLNNEEEPKISGEQATAIIQGYFTKKQGQESESMIEEGRKFLETNASKEGVTVLESGLQYEVLAEGNGINMPKLEDNVTTHYHGTLMDGTVFDSSVDRGEPASFPVNGVIKGWTEALQLMSVGSKWKLMYLTI